MAPLAGGRLLLFALYARDPALRARPPPHLPRRDACTSAGRARSRRGSGPSGSPGSGDGRSRSGWGRSSRPGLHGPPLGEPRRQRRRRGGRPLGHDRGRPTPLRRAGRPPRRLLLRRVPVHALLRPDGPRRRRARPPARPWSSWPAYGPRRRGRSARASWPVCALVAGVLTKAPGVLLFAIPLATGAAARREEEGVVRAAPGLPRGGAARRLRPLALLREPATPRA